MKFYTFGKTEAPIIMLFPGTCCHWKRNFEPVIPMLERNFCVVCASYDGFDETENSIFPDMLTETAKIEDYIKENFGGHICAAYGCSMGGSFVGLLVQRKQIHIDHAILGSSDLDQETGPSARIKAWLIAKVLYTMMWIMAKTAIGRLAATDHCCHAVTEMEGLDRAWAELRAKQPEFPMPNWDALRSAMPDWAELHRQYDN